MITTTNTEATWKLLDPNYTPTAAVLNAAYIRMPPTSISAGGNNSFFLSTTALDSWLRYPVDGSCRCTGPGKRPDPDARPILSGRLLTSWTILSMTDIDGLSFFLFGSFVGHDDCLVYHI